MNLSAWKVRTRLSIGFGVVCALLLVIVVIGLSSMKHIEDGVIDVMEDRWPKIVATHAILAQTDTIAIALRNMMLTQDAADRQKQVENITKARQTIGQNIEQLQRTVTLPKGKELLQ